MMRANCVVAILFSVFLCGCASSSPVDSQKSQLDDLDAYWSEVSRSVKQGDFEAYAATCHKDGVLVAGTVKKCHPLSQALARWKKEFDDTKAGTRKSSVEFRFSQRLADETTALETGIFLYAWSEGGGETHKEYIHFEALLLKRNGWKIMMEYQKSKATAQEWDALGKTK
jgi:outer membrane murein-binding lipoprotein Lpp